MLDAILDRLGADFRGDGGITFGPLFVVPCDGFARVKLLPTSDFRPDGFELVSEHGLRAWAELLLAVAEVIRARATGDAAGLEVSDQTA